MEHRSSFLRPSPKARASPSTLPEGGEVHAHENACMGRQKRPIKPPFPDRGVACLRRSIRRSSARSAGWALQWSHRLFPGDRSSGSKRGGSELHVFNLYHPAARLPCPGCHWLSEPRRPSHRRKSYWRAEPVRSGGTFGRATRQPLSFALAPLAVGLPTAAERVWLASASGTRHPARRAATGRPCGPTLGEVGRPAPSKIRPHS